MKQFILCFIISSAQLFSQSYLNILLSNDSYKNSQISEIEKITLSSSGDLIYFHLVDQSVVSENTSDVKKFLFGNLPLGEPLPVELSTFTAMQIGSQVLLKWTTETEINNYGFDVERTIILNGNFNKWNKIGFVEGCGNSNSPQNYSFTDNPEYGNKYCYRLKQIDSDGKIQYSDEIFIELGMINEYSLTQNYPNPFNPTTNIKYSLPFDANVKVTIYNTLGEVVDILINDYQKAGSFTIPFNASELSSGIYFCTMNSGGFSSSIKMILIK